MNTADLIGTTHHKYLNVLKIYRLVQSTMFQQVYEMVNDEEKCIAQKYIDAYNKKGLIEWIRDHLRKSGLYELLPIKELRMMGKELGCVGYAHSSKISIVAAINKSKNNGHS